MGNAPCVCSEKSKEDQNLKPPSPRRPKDELDGLTVRVLEQTDEKRTVKFSRKVIYHPKGHPLASVYDITGELGRGNFGVVSRLRPVTGSSRGDMAAKSIALGQGLDATNLQNEITLLDRLDHPNVIRVYEVFEDDSEIVLVMGLCAGGELFQGEEGALPALRVADISSQVLGALIYMHRLGVAHRDLKPANILYATAARTLVKVADFGISKLFKFVSAPEVKKLAMKRGAAGLRGPSAYLAPEVHAGSKFMEKCDIWSLGVVVYEAFAGPGSEKCRPFRDVDEQGCPREEATVEPLETGVGEDAWAFVTALLAINPGDRPSAQEASALAFMQRETEAMQRRTLESLHLPQELLERDVAGLKEYAHAGPIRRLAADALARHVRGEECRQATVLFEAFDGGARRDGRMSSARFKEVWSKAPGISESDADEIVGALEEDGGIDYLHFLAATIGPQLVDALEHFEVPEDIYVTLSQLRLLVHSGGDDWPKEVEELADARGQVSIHELAKLGDGEKGAH